MNSYENFSDIPNDYITKSSRDYDNERELYQVTMTEAFNQWGSPITYYFADYNVTHDPINGEDAENTFTSAAEMMAFFVFPNRSRVYNQFGIVSVETFNIYITMDHFDAMTGGAGYAPYTGRKPMIGDVVRNHYRDPWGYTFYELANVNYTESQFEQGQHYWTLTMKLYNDNKLFVSDLLKDDPIYANSNRAHDIFDVTSAVDEKKINTLYNGGSLEPGRNSYLLGDW